MNTVFVLRIKKVGQKLSWVLERPQNQEINMVILLSECLLNVFQQTYYFCICRLGLRSFSALHSLSTLSDSQIPTYHKSRNFYRKTISTDTHIHNESFARPCVKEQYYSIYSIIVFIVLRSVL